MSALAGRCAPGCLDRISNLPREIPLNVVLPSLFDSFNDMRIKSKASASGGTRRRRNFDQPRGRHKPAPRLRPSRAAYPAWHEVW